MTGRMTGIRAVAAAAAFAVAGVLAGAAPAQAAVSDHCLVAVDDPDGGVCYATFDEARAAFLAMGGQISESKHPASGARAGLISLPTLLMIGYDSTGQNPFGGTDWFYGYYGGCTTTTADVDYQVTAIKTAWKNVISSTTLFSNCWANLYADTNFGGSSTGYQGSKSSLSAALNNNAESIRFS